MFDENSNTAAGAGAVVAQSGALAPGTIPGNVSAPNSAIVTQLLNVKDSRWLQVEVCREFQRGQCARSDLECKFAHPPPHVDVQQGRVTACYDSIKNNRMNLDAIERELSLSDRAVYWPIGTFETFNAIDTEISMHTCSIGSRRVWEDEALT
ncbi:hypothetical protein Y032_0741g1977 [Ancylostoma ceylanicum]|nr:hypothetical protein Y032_0741g1977 [Ancylostoma ceylanicum]